MNQTFKNVSEPAVLLDNADSNDHCGIKSLNTQTFFYIAAQCH